MALGIFRVHKVSRTLEPWIRKNKLTFTKTYWFARVFMLLQNDEADTFFSEGVGVKEDEI